MFSSIRARLWLSYAALIATALAVVAGVLALFMVRNPFVYRQTYLRLQAAEGVLTSQSPEAGQLAPVAQAFGVRVLRFAANGTLLKDSAAGPALGSPRSILGGRAQAVLRDPAGRSWLYSRTRLKDGTWLLIVAPRPKLLPALGLLRDELWRPIVQGALVGLLLSLVLAYFLARWIGDPLQRLVVASRSVFPPASQAPANVTNAHARVDVHGTEVVSEQGPEEVRALTRAFNMMVARVVSSQRSQRDFVANVSHELKTPLTSIQGFAQALMDGATETPEARRQAAEVIYGEAGRMHRLALDLLELARLDAGTADLKIGEVDVASLLGAVVEKFKPMGAAAGVSIELTMMGPLPVVSGDGDRLAQVLTNLVDNALKFTPRGGAVSLGVRQEKDQLRLAVADTGHGISARDVPHIFDRFYQADAARGGGEKHGTGLGLAIAREIVVAHGGTITVRSAPGHGAEFVVCLPVVNRRRG